MVNSIFSTHLSPKVNEKITQLLESWFASLEGHLATMGPCHSE